MAYAKPAWNLLQAMPIANSVTHSGHAPDTSLISRASAQETQREFSNGQSDHCMICLNHPRGNTNEKLIYCVPAPLHETGITTPDKPIAKIHCSAGDTRLDRVLNNLV